MTASLITPKSPAEWREARRLAEVYVASLNLDLSFQNFAQELEHFETEYSSPSGAFYWLAKKAPSSDAGCGSCLTRSVKSNGFTSNQLPRARLGKALCRHRGRGKQLGYARLVLDTLPSMLEARSLYHAWFARRAYRQSVAKRRFLNCGCRLRSVRADRTEIRALSLVLLRGDWRTATCPCRAG
jgi:hypothetical protein